jgi:hypothetical protein
MFLENQEFEKKAVVVNGRAPFAVVIFDIERLLGPIATHPVILHDARSRAYTRGSMETIWFYRM